MSHRDSTAMAQLINPVNGYRGQLKEQGKKVRNHMSANRAAIAQLQEDAHSKAEASSIAPKERMIPAKYRDIQSKVGRPPTATHRPPRQPDQNNQIGFGGSFSKHSKPPTPSNNQVNNQKLTRQTLEQFTKNQKRTESQGAMRQSKQVTFDSKALQEYDMEVNADIVDFENMNPNQKQLDNQSATPTMHKSFGKVPQYLNRYNEEAAALEQRKADLKAKSKMPVGCKQLSEEERIQTLEDLIETKNELQTILNKMPISMGSEGLRKKKEEVENKLKQVDAGVNTFSKKVVYVKE